MSTLLAHARALPHFICSHQPMSLLCTVFTHSRLRFSQSSTHPTYCQRIVLLQLIILISRPRTCTRGELRTRCARMHIHINSAPNYVSYVRSDRALLSRLRRPCSVTCCSLHVPFHFVYLSHVVVQLSSLVTCMFPSGRSHPHNTTHLRRGISTRIG